VRGGFARWLGGRGAGGAATSPADAGSRQVAALDPGVRSDQDARDITNRTALRRIRPAMTPVRFCLFDTAIGRCGIAWGATGIVAVQLPEADDAGTRARMLRNCAGAREGDPDGDVAAAIDAITALLRGDDVDLCGIALDESVVSEFDRRVYAIARAIPRGATLTYGEVARRLGDASLARAVGQSLGRNPFAPVVPCHRVLAANGRIGGFSAQGGAALKARMLLAEGAAPGDEPSLFDD
jgi:methylated-DNA-[protein]-cysteine S-methyltransferase